MTAETKFPSVATMKLSKAEYIELCDRFRDKAQEAHQDARAWMNRAILAEAQLATARAAYEPPHSPAPIPDVFDSRTPQTSPQQGEHMPRPFVTVRPYTWKAEDGAVIPGVGLFHGSLIRAHLSATEARSLADRLHDLVDANGDAEPALDSTEADRE